jgi:RHH-type proline utilization regulon transcriptional repressor/proline dehydrogenase/delta 1-pyrroline-5-carboxylate dehydrogenase
VAQLIHRALTERAPPAGEIALIAETGGQNAMVIDSSALPEQVVQDALASAFDSAGQRCSALRVLCVQQDIADKLLPMLKDAMSELSLGDPAVLATDVGPVIDEAARRSLIAHIDTMRAASHPLHALPALDGTDGTFVAPTLIEISDIAELTREVFGPVLHVLRFERDRLDALVDAINATGYGLTLGVQSRIDETIDAVTQRVHAGNLYVNRNIVGAVVGVQPFGGEGKSGTGPKAGGPLYLHRLVRDAKPEPQSLGADDATVYGSDAFDAFARWAASVGHDRVAAHCRRYAIATLVGRHVTLPGPTGETNTLAFAPRGAVGCIAATAPQLLEQLAAILATGNSAVVGASDTASVIDALPPAARAHLRVATDWSNEEVALVLVAGDPPAATRWKSELTAREGALVPIVTPDASGAYPLFRLVTERTVSVNTTASGGNASLMTLEL